MHDKQLTVSIAGSGNVATHLSQAMAGRGIILKKIWSRSSRGADLAQSLGIEWVNSPQELAGADVIILCLSDDALSPALFQQFPADSFLVHTAGSVPLSVFGKRKNVGVFYPLQTFSAGRPVDFSPVPVCIEADSKAGLDILQRLARQLSGDVRIINSKERQKIHLAAVFVSNFVNHLYKIAADILKESRLDRSVLFPLMEEVTRKARELSPDEAQTGPALRGDEEILARHLEMLEQHPDYQVIYKILSQSIKNNTSEI